MTHTFATLEVSAPAYEEIRAKLEAAGYEHAILKNATSAEFHPLIDMHGIALERSSEPDLAGQLCTLLSAYVSETGESEGALEVLARLLGELGAFRRADAETTLRREWWINHGCPVHALYGDDGEMQCNANDCRIDFKRMPLDELEMRVQQQRRRPTG